MEEKTISAEERLKQLDKERKILRVQAKDERIKRLELAAEMRVGRDEKIEKIQEKVKKIQVAVYRYNKLGKAKKLDGDILGLVQAILKEEIDTEGTVDAEEN